MRSASSHVALPMSPSRHRKGLLTESGICSACRCVCCSACRLFFSGRDDAGLHKVTTQRVTTTLSLSRCTRQSGRDNDA
jgi:hypothetical protein